MCKVDLRKNFISTDGSSSMMKDNNCQLDFVQITSADIERMLLSLPTDKPAGIDHLYGKLL